VVTSHRPREGEARGCFFPPLQAAKHTPSTANRFETGRQAPPQLGTVVPVLGEGTTRARGALSRRQRGAACSDEAAPNTSRTVQGGRREATDAMRETVDGHGGAGGRSFSRCRRRHSIGHDAVVTSHIPRPLRTHAKAGRAAPSDGRTDGRPKACADLRRRSRIHVASVKSIFFRWLASLLADHAPESRSTKQLPCDRTAGSGQSFQLLSISADTNFMVQPIARSFGPIQRWHLARSNTWLS